MGPPIAGAVRPGQPAPAAPATRPASPPASTVPVPQSAVKKMTFLNALRPTKLSDAKPGNQLLVIGNRGCKTVAAVAVETPDGVSANGRQTISATPGLPRPAGSRAIVITFDNQSSQSLLNHYGTLIDGQSVEMYHMLDPVRDNDGKIIYPGWDGSVAESGTIVAAAFKELLVSLRDAKDVGLLVVDHYGLFIEQAAKYHAYARANMPLDKKLEPSQWTARSNLLLDIDFLVRTAPMDGGWVIATGSRDRKDGDAVTTFEKGRDEFAKKEVVPSKWQEKIHSNWPTVVQVYKSSYRNGYIWEAEVEEGRHPIFPLGAKVDITGRHIGAFQLKELLKFPEVKDEPVPKLVATIKR